MSWKSFIPKNFKFMFLLFTAPEVFYFLWFSSIPLVTQCFKACYFEFNQLENYSKKFILQLNVHIGGQT